MKYYIIIISLAILLCSCKEDSKLDPQAITIEIDFGFSKFPAINEINYVPLETNEKSLIKNIKKIIARNNLFYIFDDDQKKVLIFDYDGKFIDCIHKVGSGPGEYIVLSDIDVDEKGHIYLADNSQKRIIKYNPKITNFQIINIGEYFIEFAVKDSVNILLGDIIKNGEIEVKLGVHNLNTGKTSILLKPLVDEDNKISRYSRHYFYRSGKFLSYYQRFSPYIYTFENELLFSPFFFKSNKYPGEETLEKWRNDRMLMLRDFEYIKDISAFYKAGNYIFSQFETLPKIGILYNCDTGKYTVANNYSDKKFYGYQGAFASDGEYFISYCLPTQENIDNIIEYNPNLGKNTIKELSLLTEDSNPIIILFNY